MQQFCLVRSCRRAAQSTCVVGGDKCGSNNAGPVSSVLAAGASIRGGLCRNGALTVWWSLLVMMAPQCVPTTASQTYPHRPWMGTLPTVVTHDECTGWTSAQYVAISTKTWINNGRMYASLPVGPCITPGGMRVHPKMRYDSAKPWTNDTQ